MSWAGIGAAAIVAGGNIGSALISANSKPAAGGGTAYLAPGSLFTGNIFGGQGLRGSGTTGGIKFSKGTQKALLHFGKQAGLASDLYAPGSQAALDIFGKYQIPSVPLFQTPQSVEINRAILNAIPFTPAQIAAGEISSQAPQFFADLFNPAAAAAQELVGTGFRTDIDPIRQAAVRALRRETAPMLAERFSQQTGTFSTDFLRSLNDAAGDVETELGALQAELDEAASARRAAGIGAAATLSTLPTSVAGDLFNLGESIRRATERIQPGMRLLDALQLFSGLTTPAASGAFQLGLAPSTTSQSLGALSQIVGGLPAASDLGSGLQGLFGGGGGVSAAELASIPEGLTAAEQAARGGFGFF